MALTTLKPRLSAPSLSRVKTLDTKAGATARTTGRAWQRIRKSVLLAAEFACSSCGFVSSTNQVDHDVPLEQGGTDDLSNLNLLCVACHAAKTKQEAKARYGK